MNISQKGIDFIKKWEGGPWLTAKRFGTEKYLSIGYGHYGPDVKMGMKITKSQAEDLLRKDIAGAVKHVNNINDKYHYNFNQNELDSLTSFAYNIGSINQLTANGTRSKSVIADKMLLYNKSCGKVLPGLTNRRKAERELFLSKSGSGTKGETFNMEMKVITQGMTCGQVGTMQILLKAKGFKGSNGKVLQVDNDAGANTIYALKAFQKKNGLSIDGKCGPASWDKLING